MTAPQVSLDITADSKATKTEINDTIRHLTLLKNATDVMSKSEVKAWQEASEGAKEHLVTLHANEDQMLRLRAATIQMEDKVQSTGERFAIAGERGERALSMIERSGELSGRSINSLLMSVGQLGFDLGPEGAVVAGIAMVAVGIIDHFESVQEKLTELTEKFNHNITEILLNDSAVEAARAGGRAMIAELEAIGKRRDDMLARKESIKADWRIITGQDDDNVMAEADNVDAARHARRTLATVHAGDKDIENAKEEEKRAHESLTSWQDKADALRADGKTAELRVAQGRVTELTQAQTALRAQIKALEDGRDATARLLAGTEKDPATKYALTHPDKDREHTNFDEEDRKSGVTSGDRRAEARNAAIAKADAKAAEQRRKHDADEKRAADMLTQMQDSAISERLRAEGKNEQAEEELAKRDYDRRVAEISALAVTENQKTMLLVAAAAERDAKLSALQRKAADTAMAEYVRNEDAVIREFDRMHEKRVRAEEATEQKLARVLQSSGEVLVQGHGDLARRILKAALEPEVKYLEGMAAKHYALAAKDAATQNWVGAAEQLAGATALMAGAALVGSFAGSGGGGGAGGGGGGGGGGGMSPASQMGANGNGGAPQVLHIIIEHQDQSGRTISKTAQDLQRLDDRNVPIRTGGLG